MCYTFREGIVLNVKAFSADVFSINDKFYTICLLFRMKEMLSPNKIYNLFSDDILPQSQAIKRRSKPKKTEIQVIFHHPNLLYLSSKKQKTKEDVARQV